MLRRSPFPEGIDFKLYANLKTCLYQRVIRSNEGLTLETSVFKILNGGYLNFINSFDKSKFSCFTIPSCTAPQFQARDLFKFFRSYYFVFSTKNCERKLYIPLKENVSPLLNAVVVEAQLKEATYPGSARSNETILNTIACLLGRKTLHSQRTLLG